MLIYGDLEKIVEEGMQEHEIRVFNYSKLEAELGEFERWKQFDGMDCEEVTRYFNPNDGKPIIKEIGWEIIGTTRLVEYQWTDEKKNK